jgi:transmembrane sensor
MSKKQKNIEKKPDLKKETMRMISLTSIQWDKSKEQVWSELEQKMESLETPVKTFYLRPRMSMAAAAVIILLVGISVLMQLYTKTINISPGQHSSIYLPDKSKVKINAQSTLSYKPIAWIFSRRVRFEGEAYFEVQKGKKFVVSSGIGRTTVLGTSFNIYSRNDQYRVTCISGTVKVEEKTYNREVVLNAGQKAELDFKGALQVFSGINTEQTLSWLTNRFSFTSVPVKQVFEEVTRQYNITISLQEGIDKIYTGTFDKSKSADTVLNLVCRPLNLTFIRKSQNEYFVSESN